MYWYSALCLHPDATSIAFVECPKFRPTNYVVFLKCAELAPLRFVVVNAYGNIFG